jgi:translation initiation factor IF-2
VTDIVVLVVAADDGVKPQTKDSLDIIRQGRMPYVVAINKIDKPEANIERVKKQLAELDVLAEDWGGKIVMIPVSAKDQTGLTELLDVVLLVAEMEKDLLKANPNRQAIGTIIESHIDSGEGPVATVLVQTGTLRHSDLMVIGNSYGKVKMLKDYLGRTIESAGPSTPARIIGLKGAPAVGEILQVVDDLSEIKKRAKGHQNKGRTPTAAILSSNVSVKETTGSQKIVSVVLKADTLGSLEAIAGAIEVIQNDEVAVKIIQKGLGNITEADVLAAETGKALLYGFNVSLTPSAEAVAKGKDITAHLYKIIYNLIDDVTSIAEALLTPEVIITELGKVKILALFRTERNGMIIGGQVTVGKAVLNANVRIVRDGALIATGKINQLQTQKREVKEVAGGAECGMKYEGPPLILVGDTVEFYSEEIRK